MHSQASSIQEPLRASSRADTLYPNTLNPEP